MAFSVVVERRTGSQATNSASHSITMPTSVNVGDLILVIFSVDLNPTVTVDTGISGVNWTKLGQTTQATNVTGAVFWKYADGSDVLTLSTTLSERSTHITLRIVGPTAVTPVTGTATTGNSSNTNPPNHTPPGGAADYLWIATRMGDDVTVATVAPASFSNLTSVTGASSGASTNTAERNLNASSLDPGAWTSGLAFAVTYTLAIEPSNALEINVSESITVAEANSEVLNNPMTASAAETITVTDAVTAVLSNDLYLTVFETITVAEEVTQRPSVILLQVFESIGIDDDASVPLGRSLSERITVRDVVTLRPSTLVIRVHETITVSDGTLYSGSQGYPGGTPTTPTTPGVGPEPPAPPGATGLSDYWVVGL